MKCQGVAGVVVAAGVGLAGVGSGVAVAVPAQPGTTSPAAQPGVTSPVAQPGTTNPGVTTGGGQDTSAGEATGGGQPGTITPAPAGPVDQSPAVPTPAPADTAPGPAVADTTAEPTVADTTPVYTDPGYGQDQPVYDAPVSEQPVDTGGGDGAPTFIDTAPVDQPADAPVEAVPADGVLVGDPVAEEPATEAPAMDAPGDQAQAGEHPEAAAPADIPVAPPVLGTGEVTVAGPVGRVAARWVTVPYRTVVTTTATNARGERVDVPEVTVGTWHDGGVDYAAGGAEGFVAAPPVVAPVVDAAVAAGERLSGVVPPRGRYTVGDETLGGSVAWDNQPGTASI